MKKFIYLLSLISSISLSADDVQFEDFFNELSDIATKNKLNIDYTPGNISIIKGETLRNLGIAYISADTLDILPGFDNGFSRSSMDASKYVIMIDGMALNSQFSGVNIYPHIATKSIKRIEVIRGPSSALYGANAFTAMVNIVTNKSDSSIWMDHHIISDSNHQNSVGGMLNIAEDDYKFGLRYNYINTDGSDSTITQDAGSLAGEVSYTPQKLNNSMTNYNVGIDFGYKDFKIKYARQYYDSAEGIGMSGIYLPPKTDDYKVHDYTEVYEFSYRSIIDDWTIDLKAGGMFYSIKLDDGYVLPLGNQAYRISMDYSERNFYVEGEASTEVGSHQLLFGSRLFHSNLYHSEYETTFNPGTSEVYDTLTNIGKVVPNVTRRTKSLWFQDVYDLNSQLTIIGNLRYDKIDDIDEDVFSPRLAVVYNINDRHIIKAQYAGAFRSPVFLLLYSDGSKSIVSGYPQTGLDKSHNYELSYIFKSSDSTMKSTLYYTDMYKVHSYIQEGSITNEYNNKLQTSGLELEYLTKFNNVTLELNGAYNFYSNLKYYGPLLYEDTVTSFPEITGNILLEASIIKEVSASIWYHYKSPVKQFYSNIENDEDHLLNIGLNYYAQGLTITLSVSDLFDQQSNYVVPNNAYKNDELIYNQRKLGIGLSYNF